MQSLKTRSAVDSLFSNASTSYKNTSRSTSISASARTRGRSWSGSTIWKRSKQKRTALREHRLRSRSKRDCLAGKLCWTSWGDEKDEAVNDACCQDGPRRGVFLISLLLTRCIVSARKFTLCPRSCCHRPLRCCKPCRTEIATRTLCFSSVVTICSRMAWGCRLWLSLRAILRERPSPIWIAFSGVPGYTAS